MKKLLIAVLLLICANCYAEDKVRVSIQYKQYLYTCPDGEEILTDDNTRKYTCKSGAVVGEGAYRDVGGSLSFSKAEFDALKTEDIEALKDERIEARIYEVKNPPVPVEPTKADLEAEKANLEAEKVNLEARVLELTDKISAKTAEVIK
jgi:hypothetical protein